MTYIRWFREIRLADVPLVGGKNASLGELYSELTEAGVRVPNGFAITAEAYTALLDGNGLHDAMARILKGVTGEDLQALAEAGRALRRLIVEAPPPPGLGAQVTAAYRTRGGESGAGLAVAVRSSATAEDLPEASFAGQHETYLGVRGDQALLAACRRCFASLFTHRALASRIHQGFDPIAVRLSVGVQKMVRADRGAAGVMFTLDPESGFRDVVLINSAYGLGEAVVSGQITPDEFWIFKPTLRAGYQAILRRTLGRKDWKLVAGGGSRRVEAPPEERARLSLTDDEALELARYGVAIEVHYSAKYGRPTPMDIEWAKDGEDGRLYILQARPETVHRAERPSVLEVFTIQETTPRERLAAGQAIGQKIGVGRVRRLLDPRFLDRFQPGEVLVTPMTDPDWEPIMKRAAAIVTDRGGRTCHAAIVSRELGVPCVVGTERGSQAIPEGETVTVSCCEGERGFVYRGVVPFDRRQVDLAALPKPSTAIMLNVGNPGEALRAAALPNDGVGLARLEIIIASAVKVHPLALLHPEGVKDPEARAAIAALTRGYADRALYFVDRLAEGGGMIAAGLYPQEIMARLSPIP